jgi:hypothetical protein
VVDLKAEGLGLYTSGSVEFEFSLDEKRDKFADDLLPYVVLLANQTDRDVIAYSVRWMLKNAAGQPVYHEVSPFQFRSVNPVVLPARAAAFVSLMQGIGTAGLTAGEENVRRAQMLVKFYQAQSSITVALEAVVFADGLAVGDDRNNWIPRWQAYLDADRNLAMAVTGDAPPADVKRYLEELRDAACGESDPPIEPVNLPGYANRAVGYAACYTLWKGYFAHRLLGAMEAKGEAEALEALRAAPYWRTYPRVHR